MIGISLLTFSQLKEQLKVIYSGLFSREKRSLYWLFLNYLWKPVLPSFYIQKKQYWASSVPLIRNRPIKNNRIKKAFSGAACRYDNLSSLQKKIGLSLVSRIPVRDHYGHILDVGMGTGYLTHNLTCLYPESKVIGLDFADGMVSCARQKYDNLTIIQADAMALPFKENSFDLVISNSAYQWVDDLMHAFKHSYSILKENGVLCAAMFARGSLKEWFQSLENSFKRPLISTSIQRLVSKDQIYDAISASGFTGIEIDCDVVKVSFADMFALVRWLKAIGANTTKKQVFIGKQAFTRAAKYYSDNFKSGSGVYASFEVAWIKAKKL